MSKNISALKSIAYVVHSTLNRLGLETDKYEERWTIIATEFFSEELNLYHLPNIAVKRYTPNSTNLFKLPQDYADYTKVGMNINGEMWTLGLNKHLVKPREEACGDRIPVHSNSGHVPRGGYVFADHYHHGQLVSGLLGLGGGWNYGYFDIDIEERILSVKGALPKNEVILEYISSGVRKDGTTMIPLEAVAPMREYLLAEHYKRDDKYGRGDVLDQERRVDKALDKLDRFIETPTLDELLDIFYESYKQGAKR